MTGIILTTIFGKRKDEVFKQLKALLKPFNIARYYTDDWSADERHLDTATHQIGKRNIQKIERKNLDQTVDQENYRFFKINFDARHHHWTAHQFKVEFGVDIYAKLQV